MGVVNANASDTLSTEDLFTPLLISLPEPMISKGFVKNSKTLSTEDLFKILVMYHTPGDYSIPHSAVSSRGYKEK